MTITFDPILVHEWLSRSAQKTPGKEALVCGAKRWTYAQLNQAVSASSPSTAASSVAVTVTV